MARVIADILNAHPVEFSHLIEQWEAKTGRKGHDLSLYSDMRTKAAQAIKQLRLDPTDTVQGELYYALQDRARLDNEWLAEKLSISRQDSQEETIKKIVNWLKTLSSSDKVWVGKPNYYRALLKKQPPKATMKAIGLRSVDSMLKRNSVAEILAYASELESADWQKKLSQSLRKSRPVDFDDCEIECIYVSKDRRSKLEKSGFPVAKIVTPNFNLGALVIIPPPSRFPLDVLALTVLIAEAIYEIRKHSALYRILSVRKDFGEHIMAINSLGITRASLALSDIGWNSLHRHLVGNEFIMSRLEQPHISREDLMAQSSVDVLMKLDPRFGYWKGLEYAVYGPIDGQVISLNIVDVALNASNQRSNRLSSSDYARMRLWEELWARYLTSDHVIEDVIDSYVKQ